MATHDADKIRPILELVVGKMEALETELVAYAAVFLSLRNGLGSGPELDKLLDEARKNPDFLTLIAEKYAPLYTALEDWNREAQLLEMLKNWNYLGRKQ